MLKPFLWPPSPGRQVQFPSCLSLKSFIKGKPLFFACLHFLSLNFIQNPSLGPRVIPQGLFTDPPAVLMLLSLCSKEFHLYEIPPLWFWRYHSLTIYFLSYKSLPLSCAGISSILSTSAFLQTLNSVPFLLYLFSIHETFIRLLCSQHWIRQWCLFSLISLGDSKYHHGYHHGFQMTTTV